MRLGLLSAVCVAKGWKTIKEVSVWWVTDSPTLCVSTCIRTTQFKIHPTQQPCVERAGWHCVPMKRYCTKIVLIAYNTLHFQNPQHSKRKLPPLLSYQNLVAPPPRTRTTMNESCHCQICLIARKRLDYPAHAELHSNKFGAPSTNPKSPPAKTLAVCSKCWGEIGKGKPHNCKPTTKRENLSNIVKNTSGKSRAKVASSALKTIAEDQGVSIRGGIVNLKTGVNPLPVQIGTSTVKPKDQKFSHENLRKLQASNNLSDKTLL